MASPIENEAQEGMALRYLREDEARLLTCAEEMRPHLERDIENHRERVRVYRAARELAASEGRAQ